MTAISGLLRPGAETASLTAMNGRGDILGVTFLGDVLEQVTASDHTIDRGDEVHILRSPGGRGPADRVGNDRHVLRLYLTADAVDRAGRWRDLSERGHTRTVQQMNGRGDSVGVSLPCDELGDVDATVDVTMVPVSPGVVDLHLPAPATPSSH